MRLQHLAAALLAAASLAAVTTDSAAFDVTFRVTVPATTPPADNIYIAGDFQGWNPGSTAHQLTDLGNNVHEIVLSFQASTSLQFKFTRGDWSRVEKGPSGEEISNRTYTVAADATLELTVANWADVTAGSTITGNVTQITVPGFLQDRPVWIYLPPDYDEEPTERYPVLYMLDGQNVFDDATSFAGEWQVDEACEQLIAEGEMRPIIVVAVANGGAARIQEYTPWFDPDFGGGTGGGGEAHLQAFVTTLMPFIDANYRTLTGPANTGFSGSSLGGLMSAYAGYAHGGSFGRIGALSPTISWAEDQLLTWTAAQPKPSVRVYVDMGTLESGTTRDSDNNGIDDSIDDLRALRDVMVAQGFELGSDLMVVEDEGGRHNESFWAARFPEVLKYLFPRTAIANEPTTMGRLKQRF